MPTTFFISPDGTVADRIFGQLPTGSEFQQSLDKILQVHAQREHARSSVSRPGPRLR